MGKFSNEDVVREIKRRLSIIDLVEGYTSVTRKGKNYVGLCPFHDDTNPSMHLDADKNLFHCFSCGAGGDIFGFYMRYNNLTFPEALTELAKKANVQIERDTPGLNVSNKNIRSANSRLYKINQAAMIYYSRVLNNSPAASNAREYLSRRNISAEMIESFCLGYAPGGWNSLTGFLEKKNVPLEQAEKVGLVARRNSGNGYYDRFRNRIIFPIIDTEERVIGFGGRILDENDEPKYINSPESPVYSKRRNFYGLNKARDYIRKERCAIIVEGYTDFLSLYSRGVNNALATLGTALTSEHVSILKRYTDKAVLVFDGDESGEKAALRALEIFLEQGLIPSVVILPDDHDPDSYISSQGPDKFMELVSSAHNLLDYILDRITAQNREGLTPLSRSVREVADILSSIKDPIVRNSYIRKTAERFGLRESDVISLVKPGRSHGYAEPVKTERPANNEMLLLRLVLNFPSLRPDLGSEDWREFLQSKDIISIMDYILRNDVDDVSSLLMNFNDKSAHGIISDALMSSLGVSDEDTARKMLKSSLQKLKAKKTQSRLKSLRLEIEAAIKEKNPLVEKKLLQEYRDLMKQK